MMHLTAALVAAPRPVLADAPVGGGSDAAGHLTLPVMIGAKGPFRFVADTGADRTVIADSTAAALGLTRGSEVDVQGITRTVKAQTVPLEALKLGEVETRPIVAPVLPRALLDADGYLGLDVLDGRRVTFDFAQKLLMVAPADLSRGGHWSRPLDNTVRLEGEKGRLISADCHVDGVRAAAFIDSGAQMSIGNTALFGALQGNGAAYLGNAVVPVVGVTGGAADARPVFVQVIHLGGIDINHSLLLIADLPVFDLWGLSDRPAMLVGMNVLERTAAVTIDYGRKELQFKLASLMMASRG